MIEDFNDLLSLVCLAAIIVAFIVMSIRAYSQRHERKLIKEVIDYYKEV